MKLHNKFNLIMKLIPMLLIVLLPVFVMGQRGAYLLKMTSADIDGEKVGSFKTESIKPAKLVMYVDTYIDSLIEASFRFRSSGISFDILNKSKKSIKIIWNEAAYIGYDNNSGKIMHLGVKYIDRSEDQPATSIIGGSKITDQATPVDNIYYSSGTYGGWRELPLLPNVGKKDLKTLVGKKVKLLLPILNGAKQMDYVFTFEIVFNEFDK